MKKGILILIVIGLIIFIIGYLNNQTFNDPASMEAKISKELDIELVSIFDLQDIDEYRFVGYTYDNHHGFAAFKQNNNGDYIFSYVKKPHKMIPAAENIAYDHHVLYWIVVNNNKNLKTVELKIKYQPDSKEEIITREVTEYPSISVVKLPTRDFEAEYNFYDKKGNLIE